VGWGLFVEEVWVTRIEATQCGGASAVIIHGIRREWNGCKTCVFHHKNSAGYFTNNVTFANQAASLTLEKYLAVEGSPGDPFRRTSADRSLPVVLQFIIGSCEKAMEYSRRVDRTQTALTRLSARAAHLRAALLYLETGQVKRHHVPPFSELLGTAALVVEFHLLTLAKQHAPQILVDVYSTRFQWLQDNNVPAPHAWYTTEKILMMRGSPRPLRGNMESFRNNLLSLHVDTTIHLPPAIEAEQLAAEAENRQAEAGRRK
jgi:hypothetical protein